MDSPFTTAIFIAVAVAVILWMIRRQEKGARGMLDAWAKTQGIFLVSAEPSGFWRGPFLLAHQGRTVFRISVMDKENGTIRQGWACCGMSLTSWTEKVVVKWDS